MTPEQLIALATSVTANAQFVRAAGTATTVDLRFPGSDPTGIGPVREVAFVFSTDAAARAFLDAVKAATAPAPSAAPPGASLFSFTAR